MKQTPFFRILNEAHFEYMTWKKLVIVSTSPRVVISLCGRVALHWNLNCLLSPISYFCKLIHTSCSASALASQCRLCIANNEQRCIATLSYILIVSDRFMSNFALAVHQLLSSDLPVLILHQNDECQ